MQVIHHKHLLNKNPALDLEQWLTSDIPLEMITKGRPPRPPDFTDIPNYVMVVSILFFTLLTPVYASLNKDILVSHALYCI